MKKVNWWEGDHWSRARFTEAANELNELSYQNNVTTQQLARLFQLDREQELEIERLQTVVMALTSLIVDKGLLDEDDVAARVHGALDELERRRREAERQAQSAADAGNPFRIAPKPTSPKPAGKAPYR